MVLVVYKGSYIWVSDRFLFKKRFYFDICIGFIAIYYRNRCQTGYNKTSFLVQIRFITEDSK
jgi:hypothetical protein